MVLLVSASHREAGVKRNRAEKLRKPRSFWWLVEHQGPRRTGQGRRACPGCGQGDGWHCQAVPVNLQGHVCPGFWAWQDRWLRDRSQNSFVLRAEIRPSVRTTQPADNVSCRCEGLRLIYQLPCKFSNLELTRANGGSNHKRGQADDRSLLPPQKQKSLAAAMLPAKRFSLLQKDLHLGVHLGNPKTSAELPGAAPRGAHGEQGPAQAAPAGCPERAPGVFCAK